MSIDSINAAPAPQTQISKIPFKGEDQIQSEVVVDEEKSNAAKYMIGATALAAVATLGVLGYKGKLGPGIENFLKGGKKAAAEAAEEGTKAAEKGTKGAEKGAKEVAEAIVAPKDKLVASLEKNPPSFGEGKTEIVKKIKGGGKVTHTKDTKGAVVSTFKDKKDVVTKAINWTKDGKVSSIETFATGGKSTLNKYNKDGVLSEIVEKNGVNIVSTTRQYYNKAGLINSQVTKDATGQVTSKIGRAYNADGKEVTRVVTEGANVTKFKLEYTDKGNLKNTTVIDKTGAKTELDSDAFNTKYPDFFKK